MPEVSPVLINSLFYFMEKEVMATEQPLNIAANIEYHYTGVYLNLPDATRVSVEKIQRGILLNGTLAQYRIIGVSPLKLCRVEIYEHRTTYYLKNGFWVRRKDGD